MCYPVYGMMYIKDLLLLIAKVAHEVTTADFLSGYSSGSLSDGICLLLKLVLAV